MVESMRTLYPVSKAGKECKNGNDGRQVVAHDPTTLFLTTSIADSAVPATWRVVFIGRVRED